MKITVKQLRRIIREEVARSGSEFLTEDLSWRDKEIYGFLAEMNPIAFEKAKKILGDQMDAFLELVKSKAIAFYDEKRHIFSDPPWKSIPDHLKDITLYYAWRNHHPFLRVAEDLLSGKAQLPGLSPASVARLESLIREQRQQEVSQDEWERRDQ